MIVTTALSVLIGVYAGRLRPRVASCAGLTEVAMDFHLHTTRERRALPDE
ncbi:MAG: hypothetical protein ABSG16_03080 [Candidatus Acidiferrum sp.]